MDSSNLISLFSATYRIAYRFLF